MSKPNHHLFVCGSFRANGTPQGVCQKKESIGLIQYLQGEIEDRGLQGVEVAMTGCMNTCAKGPVVIDYPAGHWYGGVTTEVCDEILDAIESGSGCADAHLIQQ
jgi:(2Fe-2S) ferredoxin